MKRVVLEGLAISDDELKEIAKPITDLGHELVLHEKTEDLEKQKKYVKEADILVIGNMPLAGEVIRAAKNLKYIPIAFTGFDHVDLDVCKEKGIRISRPPLGRPPAHVSDEKKKQALEDERIRNVIEGKFGVSKRRFRLNRVMAKLPHTSQTAIAITFLVINLSTLLRQVFCLFLCSQLSLHLFRTQLLTPIMIGKIINNKSSSFIKA